MHTWKHRQDIHSVCLVIVGIESNSNERQLNAHQEELAKGNVVYALEYCIAGKKVNEPKLHVLSTWKHLKTNIEQRNKVVKNYK